MKSSLSPSLRRRLLAATGLAMLVLASPSAEALTLTEALSTAYNNNPQLLAQRSKLRQSDEGVSQALSGWRPTVQFTGSAGVSQSTTTGFGTTTLHPRSVDLNLTQPVYSGGRTTAATSQAENAVRSTRAQTLALEQTVLFSVISSYMDVVRDQAVLELSINNEQVLRRQLEATQDQFRVGEVTRTDVAQAESRLAAATASRVQSEGTLENSRAAFERVVGEPPGLLAPPAERPVLPTSRAEAANLAQNNNPNVIAAQFVEAAARDNVRVVRSQLLPQISIVGDLNRSIDTQVNLHNLTNDSASLTARMTVPLYEGGQVYSQTRQAMEAISQRRSELDDSRRQVTQTAAQDWESLQAQRANIKALIETIRAAQIALDGVRQEALVGSRTILDILDAEQELFTDRVNLVRAQHDEVVTSFDLAQQTGRLGAADLKLPVEIYDFDKHYNAVREKWIGFGAPE